jgi:glycosyltransferase involved in cell wall biosynthesis
MRQSFEISIITINYNNREGLKRTIESVLSQHHFEFEYIVIDGGSTDGSIELLQQYNDRINLWKSEPDNGIYHAMNKGIAFSRGEYINFINSGDVLTSRYSVSFAASLLSKIQNSKEKKLIFVMDCLTVDVTHLEMMRGDDIKMKSDSLNKFIPHPSTFYKRELFGHFGNFNERNTIVSDFEWYMNAIFFSNLALAYSPFCYSIFYKDGVSSGNSIRHKYEFDEVVKNHFTRFQIRIFSSRKYKFFKNYLIFRRLMYFLRFDRKVRITIVDFNL